MYFLIGQYLLLINVFSFPFLFSFIFFLFPKIQVIEVETQLAPNVTVEVDTIFNLESWQNVIRVTIKIKERKESEDMKLYPC